MKPPRFFRLVLVSLALAASAAAARAQLYVANAHDGTISEYDAASGALNRDSMVTGLGQVRALVYDQGALYVINESRRTVAKYDAQTGQEINKELVTGLERPNAIAISGRDLYVSSLDGTMSRSIVGKYDAITGAVENYQLISTQDFISGLAFRGQHLFAARGQGLGIVDEYDAITGGMMKEGFLPEMATPAVMAQSGNDLWVSHAVGVITKHDCDTGRNSFGWRLPLVSGLVDTCAIAMSGDDLYIASGIGRTIGKYNASTGAVINPSFITGLTANVCLAAVPSSAGSGASDSLALLFDKRSYIVLLMTVPPWVVDGIGLCVLALVIALIVKLLMRVGAGNRSLQEEVFPNGVKKVSILSFSGEPVAGCLIVSDGVQAQLAGLQVGDIIVALDGIQVENEEQYLFVDATGTDSRMTWILWRGDRYQEISAWVPERKLDARLQTYPSPSAPANP